MSKLNVIILAAGKGTRMHSNLPKVLHQLGHKSLLQHVIDSARALSPEKLYVIAGHGKAAIEAALAGQNIAIITQAQQLGTGHAVQQAVPYIKDDEDVLIVYGDVPLIAPQTLQQLQQAKPTNGMALLTVNLADPTGYGRILRRYNQICGIVEQKDATPEQLTIHEINTGIMLVPGKQLKQWLGQLTNHNQQQEYYLTDIVAMAYQHGCPIASAQPQHHYEVEGVNNRLQLANLERIYQQQQAQALLMAGVTLRDPARFDLRGTLTHGKDVVIDSNVIIEGDVFLGDNVHIGAGTILKNCRIEANSVLSPYSIIEDSELAEHCTVGPFARLRPGAKLAEAAHVGNFVEMKQATLGKGSKAGHLTYLGDSEIGANVNIGAGTITCNYDGANKFKTIIGDDVFIGSDTQLVAPVTVANGATIGAGTTVTQNVAENELVLSRVKQQHIQGWQRPQKQQKK